MQASDSSASASSWQLSQPFDRDILVFDVETTGINPGVHQIVSIGALLLDRTTLDTVTSMSTLVRLTPEAFARANPKAMQIHELTFSQLEAAPTPAEVVTQFLDTFGEDFYFCGWNVCFDTQFLRALFDQAGRLQDFDTFRYHRLDLWSLLELAWLRGLLLAPPDSLSIACGLFGIERPSVHDAMEDARVSALILRRSLPMLVGGRKEEVMEPSSAAGKSGQDKAPASLDGSMDWRELLNGWLKVAHESSEMHYEAQRCFNKRGRWIGVCATALTAFAGATAIKEIGAASPDPLFRWIIAGVAAAAGVLTALHTFLGDEARAASHRSAGAGYATARRKIDEDLTFGHTSASDAQKAADAIRLSLDSLSRDAPEVPAGILKKYWSQPANPTANSAE
ncbi:MAG: SLATT domain-containing protein [Terracidiphilus sp.]